MEVASVDVRVEQVTVYARGARVRRATSFTGVLPDRVRITGLPLAVIDDTVRVEVTGPAIATNVRAGVEPPPPEVAAAEVTEPVRAARRRVALADTEVERLRGALERIAAASIIEDDPSDEPPAAWSAIVGARTQVAQLRAARELVLREQLAAARREREQASRALQAAEDRERRGGTDRPAKQHELRKLVDIELVPTAGASGPVTIHVEYLVAAARWAPSYVAKLDGDRVTMEVRAIVAQAAGEDWTGVALRLSTAEPARFAELPELAAQRIGRRQDEPARRGFRAPPVGAEALYADYDRDVLPLRAPRDEAKPREPTDSAFRRDERTYIGGVPAQTTPATNVPYGADRAALAGEVWDEETSAAKEAFATPPRGSPQPAFGAMPEAARALSAARGGRATLAKGDKKRAAPSPPATTTMAAPMAPSAMPIAPSSGVELERAASGAPVPRLDYGSLVMAPPSSAQRGRLVPDARERGGRAIDRAVRADQAKLDALPLPSGCRADWSHTYDYAFDTDGAVDVRADGAWHSIAVTARASAAKLHHVAVPREQADVFRVAHIPNPFAGPLLPAPIDVYERGRFLVTSVVDFTPPGANVELGLGVDPAVKIARNTEFREEAAGMLRGALRLHHAITIDIENVSGRPIDLEVRERLPVTRDGDDDVEVILGRVDPMWERWTPDPDGPHDRRLRGGHRWRLAIPAGQKRTLRAAYEVKIAGKLELVGGNRREA
ncbi:MAG TPA: DUF4139 domain-containing protein [Kofleriaceae bacterium]|nr:DUF4139 domain-containing protein [Kofleriaceae bacterium]